MVGNGEGASQKKWQRFISKWRRTRKKKKGKNKPSLPAKFLLYVPRLCDPKRSLSFPRSFPQGVLSHGGSFTWEETHQIMWGCFLFLFFNKCVDLFVDNPILKTHQQPSDWFGCLSEQDRANSRANKTDKLEQQFRRVEPDSKFTNQSILFLFLFGFSFSFFGAFFLSLGTFPEHRLLLICAGPHGGHVLTSYHPLLLYDWLLSR